MGYFSRIKEILNSRQPSQASDEREAQIAAANKSKPSDKAALVPTHTTVSGTTDSTKTAAALIPTTDIQQEASNRAEITEDSSRPEYWDNYYIELERRREMERKRHLERLEEEEREMMHQSRIDQTRRRRRGVISGRNEQCMVQ